MLTLIELYYAFQIAIFAHVLTLLMQEGNILDFWSAFLSRKQWTWPAWVLKPLGACERCFCGQVGFWCAVLSRDLSPAEVIIFTATVIFTTELFRKYG